MTLNELSQSQSVIQAVQSFDNFCVAVYRIRYYWCEASLSLLDVICLTILNYFKL